MTCFGIVIFTVRSFTSKMDKTVFPLSTMADHQPPQHYDLKALLANLDSEDVYTVFALLDVINKLIHQYGDMPRDKSTWNDKHYLIYLLHNTMMALLRKEVRPLAFAMAEKLGHCEVSRQEKGNA